MVGGDSAAGSSDYNLSAHWALLPLYLMNPFIVKPLQKGGKFMSLGNS